LRRAVATGLVVAAVVAGSVAGPAQPGVAEEPTLTPGGSFFDDDGDVHEGAIEAIFAAGITRGCASPDLFCPNEPITRGQMAAFLVRALEAPPAADPATFEDTAGSVFADEIGRIATMGITQGCAERRFCPDEAVTRGQMAAFLNRAFDLDPSGADPYLDDDGSVFEADIAAIHAAGITAGCAPGRFCPEDPVTRGQMASFLTRALGLIPANPPPRPSLELAFTGDTLIHMQLTGRAAVNGDRSGRAYDFSPMFDPVRSLIADADLALCHLEVPLAADNRGLSGYPTFNAPRQLADGLADAGFDGCSTASNHSFDQGVDGVVETLAVLESVGLGHAGMARTAAEADRVTTYQVGDVEIAHISATWWLNGFRLPGAMPWLVEEPLDTDRLIGLAESARANGADFVVAAIHCCVEYQTMPTPFQKTTARTLVESDAIDLVVGHHAHVVQPIELHGGEYIVYGLGNFVSAQRRRPETIDGVIVLVDVALRNGAWVTRSIDYVPTWVEPGTYRVLPAAETIAAGAGALESTLRASWKRTSAAIGLMGAEGVEPRTRP
jgi:poly-gamma-glutamate capsule biosynthesis protein CapA/YwtB (metallophosphatase superfamily)